MDTKYNPFGFNKQTEALLCGVGGNNLIKEFKRRDISTDVLHKLTEEDFIQLGADEHLAKVMFQTLYVSKEKTPNVKLKPHQRISDKIEILKIGKKQFNVIQDFITYCRFKLKKKRINSFIEPDEALSASKVLCLAADSILKEVNETELKLKELEAVIIMLDIL
ncbi:synaptogyrin-2 [Lasius niger]|uniref:Synaptogyrin-2 n=1 Tax=Lasius niger TaxID=67767 RepID=A0A0J7KJV7_LASNI|nr:synaptogyrin-2 [Lasius niger]